MLPFTYEQFSEWYDSYASWYAEPARVAAVQALNELFSVELGEPDRIRVRVQDGRVKSKVRTWQKVNARYEDHIEKLWDIPDVLDDLVGLRIVCTNLSDLSGVVDVLSGVPELEDGDAPVLAVIPGSIRDYVSEPKPSGYRAYHLNLRTAVAVVTDRYPVTCELQVRTLLQDSWGELTHEDTYKPGSELPPLVDTLSRRMAALMATLDDIAEDLREEIERLAATGADTRPTDLPAVQDERPAPEHDDTEAAESADLEPARRYLQQRIGALERPIDLASLAWELRREFGQDIGVDWLGHGAFKELVIACVPDVRLTSSPPTYVLPAGFSAEVWTVAPPADDVPRAAYLLHETDRSFPLVSDEHWQAIYAALSDALAQVSWTSHPDLRQFNDLTRDARDTTIAQRHRVTRRQLSHVAKALRLEGLLGAPMSPQEIASIFTKRTIGRAADLGLSAEEIARLGPWLNRPPN